MNCLESMQKAPGLYNVPSFFLSTSSSFLSPTNKFSLVMRSVIICKWNETTKQPHDIKQYYTVINVISFFINR